jgi:hypothetical protein
MLALVRVQEARRYLRISLVQMGERNWNREALAEGVELQNKFSARSPEYSCEFERISVG